MTSNSTLKCGLNGTFFVRFTTIKHTQTNFPRYVRCYVTLTIIYYYYSRLTLFYTHLCRYILSKKKKASCSYITLLSPHSWAASFYLHRMKDYIWGQTIEYPQSKLCCP